MRLVHIERTDPRQRRAVCLLPLCDWTRRVHWGDSRSQPKTLSEVKAHAERISAAIHARRPFPAADEELLIDRVRRHLLKSHGIRDAYFVLDGFYAPGDEPEEAV